MICEKILGTLDTLDVAGKRIEYVEIEWDEAFKRIHRKVTDGGQEIGIRMEDDSVLTRGLTQDTVIYMDDALVIAVSTPPCRVVRATVGDAHMIPKVCYEIGNRHAQLFAGEEDNVFLTPYNEPMIKMLSKIASVEAEDVTVKLDFTKRISSGAPGHSHGEEHHHHHSHEEEHHHHHSHEEEHHHHCHDEEHHHHHHE